MRLTLISYVTVEREEGRSVYVCQPLRGPQFTTRDPLLGSALSKLGNKMRKTINEWVKDGKANRVSSWLYDPEMRTQVEKLTLVLRDRTLRWKLLLVTWPAFDRHIAFSPSIPDVVFEIASLADLDTRATEIYSEWAQSQLPHAEEVLAVVGTGSDLWTEPIEVDIDTQVRNRKKPKNILAALFGDVPLSGTEELHKVGQCLDDLAGDFETALGRSELVDEVDRMLLRNDRQGVLLVGPTSSGKTAIIHECAKRRVVRFRNRRGHKPQVWWLSPQRLISGMSYLGQWEQRWLAILREATKRDHVLYFDDLVGLFSAGRTRDSSLSAADVLRSYRAENRVRILVESTEEQLAILRRRDRALADQFHLIRVPAVSSDEALPIVLQSTANVEVQTDRFFHPETIPLIMRHQEIFAPDRAFPGKAIEMTKTLVKHSSEVVDRGVFYRLAGNQVGANLMLLVGRLGDQQAISQSLSEQLIGQPEAVSALSRIVVRFAQHLQPTDRPLGVLLLLGPTGVGKTESAKALTRLLYSDESHLVRLDMNEMTTPHAAEQLVGTFEQPEGRLTSAVRRQPNCVILLDEIEKAHPDVFDYLLQVIGEGRLTDARGRVADFRSSIILLTSNLGVAEQSASLGFETTAARRAQIYTKAAQSFFRPEFFNRIDDVLAFRSLDTSDMRKIVRIQMNDVLSRDGIQRRNVYINVAESAVERVIKTGFDSQLGARAVRRMLESEIIGPLGDCLSNLAIDHPALVYITDSVAKSGVDCQVTPLEVVRRSARKRRSNLEQVIEIGESIYERLDERLSELAASLQEVDVQLDARTHKASYYSLREYMHRCSDCLKAGKAALSQRSEPRLQLNASPSARPKRDWDGTGARRQLLDWQAQEDLRSEIKGDQGLASGEASEEILVRQIIDALTTASAFIEHALAPRNWLIGFTELTDSSSDAASEQEFKRQVGRDYEIYGHTTGAQDFLVRLVNCLRHGWQYEVDSDEAPHGFWHVAGVALSGILKPLLGTYRTEFPGKPSHLSVLRAIPVLDEVFGSCGTEPLLELAASADEKYEHWLGVISTNRLRGSEGDLITPAEQIIPTEKVRGVVGEQVVDFISGAALELSGDDCFRAEKTLDRLMRWWIDCLPVPQELLEA